jgi:short-subunit dehydrogenase
VTSPECAELFRELADKAPIDLCVYFAGVGELLDPVDMFAEPWIIDGNLMGMVRAAARVIPAMVRRGQGHFIGISSLADELLSAEAPSYHASKAGFSNYLGGLALRPKGVYVTNVRFGFVDTKMAKGDKKPLMIGVEQAVHHLERCIEKRPRVYTAPKAAIPLVKLHKWLTKLA